VTVQIDPTLLIGFEATLEGPAQALTTGGLVPGTAEELARRWVLGGGEDHGLLATFPAGTALPRAFKRIGQVLAAGADGPQLLLGSTGVDPDAYGWDSVTG
jgi:thiamine-monophosphate kinase